MELTFTQCKQIAELVDLREAVAALQDQPGWLEDLGGIDDFATVQAVNQGGCASGAFMPAVTYYQAREAMGVNGDSILDYLEEYEDNIPAIEPGEAWASYCCRIVSTAVERWASQFGELDSVNWD